MASRALEAKGGRWTTRAAPEGATVRVDGGHLDNRGGKLLAEGELPGRGEQPE